MISRMKCAPVCPRVLPSLLLTRVRWLGILACMSILIQFETDVAGLPQQDQWPLLTWLQERMAAKPNATKSVPEAVKLFRQLQQEVGLSAEAAESWNASVADARR